MSMPLKVILLWEAIFGFSRNHLKFAFTIKILFGSKTHQTILIITRLNWKFAFKLVSLVIILKCLVVLWSNYNLWSCFRFFINFVHQLLKFTDLDNIIFYIKNNSPLRTKIKLLRRMLRIWEVINTNSFNFLSWEFVLMTEKTRTWKSQ